MRDGDAHVRREPELLQRAGRLPMPVLRMPHKLPTDRRDVSSTQISDPSPDGLKYTETHSSPIDVVQTQTHAHMRRTTAEIPDEDLQTPHNFRLYCIGSIELLECTHTV